MAGNLTAQVRNIAEVTTAVAKGDLSRKITVQVRGEILELKNTINTMVDQLSRFASEVTRVAREVGTEGTAGRPGGSGRRGRNVARFDGERQFDGRQFDQPGPQHRGRDYGGGERRLVDQDHGGCARRNSGVEEHHQYDGGSAEFVCIGSYPRGARSGNRRQAGRPGASEGRGRRVEGSDGERQFDGGQPDQSGPQHRGCDDGRRQGRLVDQDHGGCARRNSGTEEHHQYDGGSAQFVRQRSDARGARSGNGRQAGRPGAGEGRGRRMEGSDGFGQFHGRQSDLAGSKYCRGHDGGGEWRSVAQNHGGCARRNSGAEEHHQHHGGSAQRVRERSDARGARSGNRRQAGRPGDGEGRGRNVEGSDGFRQFHGQQPDQSGA